MSYSVNASLSAIPIAANVLSRMRPSALAARIAVTIGWIDLFSDALVLMPSSMILKSMKFLTMVALISSNDNPA